MYAARSHSMLGNEGFVRACIPLFPSIQSFCTDGLGCSLHYDKMTSVIFPYCTWLSITHFFCIFSGISLLFLEVLSHALGILHLSWSSFARGLQGLLFPPDTEGAAVSLLSWKPDLYLAELPSFIFSK